MYYKLTPSYILRGWNKADGILVHRPENTSAFLTNEEFQVLLLCDGKTDFSSLIQFPHVKATIDKALARKVIQKCEENDCISADQEYLYYENRYVQRVVWSLTGKCNYRCRHCYMDAPGALFGEISHEEAMNLIDSMAECGILKVDLTGGEPLVRKDFWELVDHLIEKHIHVNEIYTNGWLLNEHILDEFERRGLKPEISISFDGVGWHDWMRGVKGAESRAIQAFELLQKRNYRVTAEMCLHKGNAHTIRDTVNLLSKYDIQSIKIGFVEPTELWLQNSDGNGMDKNDYIQAILEYIPLFYQDHAPMEVMFSGVISLHKHTSIYNLIYDKYKGAHECINELLCASARFNCYVGPDGRLLPCLPMTSSTIQNQFPKIQDIDLQTALSDSFYLNAINKKVSELFDANQTCGSCEFRYHCGGGCRALSNAKQNDYLDGTDQMQCFIWKSGAYKLVESVSKTASDAYQAAMDK